MFGDSESVELGEPIIGRYYLRPGLHVDDHKKRAPRLQSYYKRVAKGLSGGSFFGSLTKEILNSNWEAPLLESFAGPQP